MANFKLEDTIEEILEKMNRNGGNTEIIHAGSAFLSYKLQKNMLEEQQDRHEKQLKQQESDSEQQIDTQTKQHAELLNQQRKSNKIQIIINSAIAIAAVASAISAFISVQQTKQIIYQQNVSERAYLVLTNPNIDRTVDGNSYELKITVENIGANPAVNFSFDILAFQNPLESGPRYSQTLKIPNEISHGLQPTFRESIEFLSENTPPQYFAIRMKYLDPLLEREFDSCTYLLWGGLKDGKGITGFSHVSDKVSQKLSEFLSCES